MKNKKHIGATIHLFNGVVGIEIFGAKKYEKLESFVMSLDKISISKEALGYLSALCRSKNPNIDSFEDDGKGFFQYEGFTGHIKLINDKTFIGKSFEKVMERFATVTHNSPSNAIKMEVNEYLSQQAIVSKIDSSGCLRVV